jgi:hypothetical protein
MCTVNAHGTTLAGMALGPNGRGLFSLVCVVFGFALMIVAIRSAMGIKGGGKKSPPKKK